VASFHRLWRAGTAVRGHVGNRSATTTGGGGSRESGEAGRARVYRARRGSGHSRPHIDAGGRKETHATEAPSESGRIMGRAWAHATN
jgi:hypothetical protein